MFCPDCGALLMPKMIDGKSRLECSCGYSSEGEHKVKITEKQKEYKEVDVVEEDVEIHPITYDEECPKCGNKGAHYWLRQTRSGDEAETQFFKCTKCKHQWREY